ncbi:hypothetical protein HanIR_Chr15g0759171 [Helianthus annuus]|nr:hypothetical protein HanIR_Chr17g0886971 [Helianthus annuus]KAJ0456151.1 hypothetical protein HanIR_Chr15g0759171 [Helianthus annuus]
MELKVIFGRYIPSSFAGYDDFGKKIGMMLHSKDGELLATCYAAIRTSILILSRQLQVINKPKRVPVQ